MAGLKKGGKPSDIMGSLCRDISGDEKYRLRGHPGRALGRKISAGCDVA